MEWSQGAAREFWPSSYEASCSYLDSHAHLRYENTRVFSPIMLGLARNTAAKRGPINTQLA